MAVSSLQPNHPGVAQVVVVVVDVLVGVISEDVVAIVVVVLSLHPNQPGVLQVDVDVVSEVVVVKVPVVVVLSLQPHQPGVSQVAVRVRVLVDVSLLVVVEVVGSVLLLSYIFQFAQSRHSGVDLHSGTVSYFLITSLMTDRIL